MPLSYDPRSKPDVELEYLHPTSGALHDLSDDDASSIMSGVPTHTTHSEEKVPIQNKHAKSHRTWWKVEISAAVIAMAGMALLAGVLRFSDDKPQRNHHLFYTQTYNLNSIVAAIVTVMRVALGVVLGSALSQCMWNRFATKDGTVRHLTNLSVFDQASRGAWGSMRLIWLLGVTRLGTVGAMITILSLAFGTLAQQLVGTTYRSVPVARDQGIAQVVRSEYYANWDEFFIADNIITGPDLPTRAAFSAGVLAGNRVEQLPTTCSTGNCTYPVTPSVGVCGACSNITDRLNNTAPYGLDSCSYYGLPNNITMGGSTENETTIFSLQQGSNGLYADNDTIYLAQFDAIGVPYSKYNKTDFDSWMKTTPIEAHECALWFCLQAISTSITNGVQRQVVVAEWSKTMSSWPPNSDYGPTDNFTEVPHEFNVAPDAVPAISLLAVAAYQDLVNKVTGVVNVTLLDESSYYYSYTSDNVLAVWTSNDDLASWIANLATSLSNNIRRTTPAPPHPAYAGIAYDLLPYVRVNWAWLAFPAALVLGTIVFLGLTIRITSQRSLKAWKSDPLPLLFVDVDEQTRELADGGMGKEDGIKDQLGEYQVRLIRTGEQRWAFQSL